MKINNWIQRFKQDSKFSCALGRLILANMVKVGRNEIISSSKNPGRMDGRGRSRWETKQRKRMERRNQRKVL